MRIFLRDPSGDVSSNCFRYVGRTGSGSGKTELLIYYGEPSPFNAAQEIYIEFVPEQAYVESGIWIFRFLGERGGKDTYVDLWLPSSAALGQEYGFSRTVAGDDAHDPSTAFRPLTVGAYDSRTGSMPRFPAAGTPESTMPKAGSRSAGRQDHGSEERRRI